MNGPWGSDPHCLVAPVHGGAIMWALALGLQSGQGKPPTPSNKRDDLSRR